MKKFESIGGFLVLIAIIIHFIGIPGGDILLILTLTTLSIFYYCFSFALFNQITLRNIFKKAGYKDTNRKRIIGSIGLGVGISSLIMGVLFKLQFYPGARFLLGVGTLILAICGIVSLIFFFQNHSDFSRRTLKRICMFGIVGVVFLVIPGTVFIDIYYRDFPDYAELYKNSLQDPGKLQLEEQLFQKRNEMHEQKQNAE